MSKRIVTLLVFATGVSLSLSPLCAQNSEISGRVTDPSKAPVKGAQVTITRVDTGDRRSVETGSEGRYTFPLLVAGNYEINIAKDGFQQQARAGITVETGQVSSVDVELVVGSVTETVEVTADAPLLQSESAAVAAVVENKTIMNMPLLDRRSGQLQRLSGFVVANGTGSAATFAIAGGRGNNANYLIDGGSAQNLTLGVPTLMFDPPVESMHEFNVSISNYSAELGRTGGGVIQMTTKSGTNQFHGSTYEFFRNDALNTRTFFSSTIPPLRYNLFGASLGGPVIKDRTFFFFTYEGRRQVAPTNRAVNVPTVAEVRGDYSAASYIVKDPANGNPFPGNVIPAARLDPVGSKIALFYPVPNVPGAASGRGNFNANTSARTSPNDYVARVDHTFNANNRFYDRNFSPNVINEARYTYTRRKAFSISAAAGTSVASEIGLKGTDPSFFPTVVVQGFQTIGAPTQQQRLQGPIRSDAWNNNLTIIRNKHTIKLGGEYRYSSNLDKYSPTAGGSFTFNNVASGSALAALQLGWVQQASLLATYPILSRSDSYGFYIQDDWRLHPKLTLNLGLRWDIDQPRWEKSNRQNSFDPLPINPVSNTPGIITFSGLNGVSKYAHGWDLNNIGPRIGFAYRATDKWVIRGGGALLFAGEYDQATPIVANTGFATQGSFVSPDNGVTAAFILGSGLPATLSPTTSDLTPGFGGVPVGARPTTAVTFFNRNRTNGYLYQASLDIQREFAGNLLVDIGYLGTFGHHLPAPDALSINQVPTNLLRPGNTQSLRPFPQFSNVQIIAADLGASKFNGLNIGVEKRYSSGLLFKANYTFAKLLDNAASRNELAAYPGVGAFTDYYNQANNWGRSGNDIRHRFIFSTVYELPVGRNRQLRLKSRALDFVAGGWSIGAVSELATGTGLSPATLTNTSNSFSDGQRPNVVGDPRLDSPSISRWFNTAAFAAPAANTFGNAGRTFGNGPGQISVDSSLLKDFSVSERIVLQFRAEALNILNHANFANPNTQFGSPTFGQITSLISGNQSRILQLGARLSF